MLATLGVDETVQEFLLAHREPWLTTGFRFVTNIGSSIVIIPALAVALVWASRRRTRQQVGLLVAAYLGSVVLYDVIKLVVGRARPPVGQAVANFSGFAFPSGHATQTVAFYGMLAAIVTVNSPNRRMTIAAWAAAAAVSLVVGFSRLYLGVHWLTDVLGGYALGAAWLAVLLSASRRWLAFRDARRAQGSAPQPQGRGATG